MSENTFKINDLAPISMIAEFAPAANEQTQQYWGSLDLMFPIASVINFGVASAVGSVGAAAVGSVVRKGNALANAATTLTVIAKERFKGAGSISCQATSAVGLEVILKGVASGSANAVTSGSAKQVNKGLVTIQAMSTVVAAGNKTDSEIVVSLADMSGVSIARSVLHGWLDIEGMGALEVNASATVFQAEVVVNTPAVQRGANIKGGAMANKTFRSVWRDEMPDEDETKKRRAALNANDRS